MQNGGNVGQVLGRLIKGVNVIGKQVTSTSEMESLCCRRPSRATTASAG